MSDSSESSYSKKSPLNLILIYVVIGLVVYGAIYYFAFYKNSSNGGYSDYSQTTGKEAQNPTAQFLPSSGVQNTIEVVLTKDGFEPENIEVGAGTKVTWINSSGSTATVNSGPHPDHTEYDPLNLGTFDDGDILSLTFTNPGTYHFHNHYNEEQTGVLIVK